MKTNTASLKQVTAAHFAKAAGQYTEHAHVQKQAADILLKTLDKQYNTVLDLGSGPFVNSFELKKRAKFVVSADLSEAMLATKVTQSVCADMDNLPFLPNSFDLVFSNFAMQWSNDLAALLKQIKSVLKPGGKAHFSLVSDGTLHEIAETFKKIDNLEHINKFSTEEEIQSALALSQLKVHAISFCQHKIYYESAKDALTSIKAIGANHKNSQNSKRAGLLGKNAFRNMLSNYPVEQGKYPVSYHVAYIVVEK